MSDPPGLIGRPLTRREDERLLRGAGRSVDDIGLPKMAFVGFVRSHHAHAGITAIRAPADAPGLLAVITARELHGRVRPLPINAPPDVELADQPHPVLAADEVRYVGQPVAAVIATSRALAEDAAELVEVDYEPRDAVTDPALSDVIARGLKTSRSHTIGVLIPDITNPLFPPILRGIEDRLDEAGYTSLIVNTDNDPGRERIYLEAMRGRQVDGFIAATARLDRELLVELAAAGTPLVLVNRSLEDGSVPAVTVDDRRGIALAVEHVAGLGHKQIGHVAGPQNLSTGHRRHLGFVEAIRAAGLKAPKKRVRFASYFTEDAGAHACGELLDAASELTAIVAANDLLAIGCYDALEALGLRCPEDISIAGFNDMPFVDRLRPALTTVRVPQREIGQVAADLLLEQLSGVGETATEILLEPTLVVRDSTARPRRA